jgi:hypothetical protein
MRAVKAAVVQILFGSIDDVSDGCRMASHGWAAMVSEQGVCVYLVMTGEKRDDVVPDSSRKQDRMQQDNGWFVVSHQRSLAPP